MGNSGEAQEICQNFGVGSDVVVILPAPHHHVKIEQRVVELLEKQDQKEGKRCERRWIRVANSE